MILFPDTEKYQVLASIYNRSYEYALSGLVDKTRTWLIFNPFKVEPAPIHVNSKLE